MSLHTEIYTRLLLPVLEEKRYGGLSTRLRNGKALERQMLEANLSIQWEKTRAMLAHASRSVPFYQRRFRDSGIILDDIRCPDDLKKLPILTREDIRNNYEDLWSREFDRGSLLEAATGGTTDSPISILRDPECIKRRTAIQLQFNSWANMLPGDKVLWLWGAVSDYAANPSWRWRIFDRYFMRRVWAPTSLLNEAVLARYAHILDTFRPAAIMAYPAPAAAFCEYLLSSRYRGYTPKGVVCTAEPLMAEQRVIIEKALGCRPFEHYGTRDFGLVAGECEMHDGLHVHPEAILAETLPMSDAEDGLHELIVTDLLNPGFPLIRYKINDCVHHRAQSCPCGRGFPMISNIEGRTTDNFYLANGDLVPGVALTNRAIKTASGIKKMQVIQESPTLFVINYVPDSGYSENALESLRKKLAEFLGSTSEFRFKRVDEIPREKSGKTRLCISKVKHERVAKPQGS